jgi:predicted nucleotidyltransferase
VTRLVEINEKTVYHDCRARNLMAGLGLRAPEQAALDDFIERIRAAFGSKLVELRLFGSKARGDSRADSDIDVLVVVSGDRVKSEDLAIDIAFDVNLAHDVYISPRVLTADSLRDPLWRTTLFVRMLEREGVPL